MIEETITSPYAIDVQNGCCQVTLAGDLTAATIPGLQPALRSVLNQSVSEVVFDLTDAVMLDSSGIGFVIAAANTMARHGGKVRITNVSADILRLLQMMRLADRLHATGRQGQESRRG